MWCSSTAFSYFNNINSQKRMLKWQRSVFHKLAHDKKSAYLCNLLDIYDIFGIFSIWTDYLGTSSHLSHKKEPMLSIIEMHLRSRIGFKNRDRNPTWRGCSSCIICLSETRSHWLGAAKPVSDSLIPRAQANGIQYQRASKIGSPILSSNILSYSSISTVHSTLVI